MKRLIEIVSILILFPGCSWLKSSRFEDRVSFPELVKRYETIDTMGRKVIVDANLFPSDEAISLPLDAPKFAIRQFFDSYLDLHDSLIVERGNELHVANFNKFDAVWMTDIDAARKKSSDDSKPLLVLFTSPGCLPCRQFKYDAFRHEKLYDELRNYVLLKLDVDMMTFGESKEYLAEQKLADDLGLQNIGFPTIVLLSPYKKEIITGYEGGKWENIWGRMLVFRNEAAKL